MKTLIGLSLLATSLFANPEYYNYKYDEEFMICRPISYHQKEAISNGIKRAEFIILEQSETEVIGMLSLIEIDKNEVFFSESEEACELWKFKIEEIRK